MPWWSGMNEQGCSLADRLARRRAMPASTWSAISTTARRTGATTTGGTACSGGSHEIADYVKANKIHLIYLSLPMASQPRIKELLDALKDTTASVYFVPDMFVTDLIQGRTDSVCGLPVISVCETPFRGPAGLLKRTSDLVLATLILILLAPFMLVDRAGGEARLAGPGDLQAAALRPGRRGDPGLQVPLHDRHRGRRHDRAGAQERRAGDADGRDPAQDLPGRAAAVHQRAAGPHEHRGAAAARRGPQRAVPAADQELHGAAQGQAGHHGLGPGQRLPRRDRFAGKDGRAHPVRPGLPAQLVAAGSTCT